MLSIEQSYFTSLLISLSLKAHLPGQWTWLWRWKCWSQTHSWVSCCTRLIAWHMKRKRRSCLAEGRDRGRK